MNYKKKKKNRYLILVLAIITLVSTVINVGTLGLDDDKGYRTIRVVEASGRASVVKDGIEYEAYPGMLLQEGHEIATAGNSHVRLALDDDKYIKIESGSRVIFETLGLLGSGKTKIALERGAMTNELVNPLRADEEYIVSTPNAVLAVRGTFFRVDLTVSKTGDITADVKTYGGQVASQRIQPNGVIVDEEVLIDAGYMTTINMTPTVTHYVVETTDGEQIIVEPDEIGNEAVDGQDVLPTRPIVLENISDEDLVDVYFSSENGHELFVTAEEAKANLEERDINLEEYTSVYEKAEKVEEKNADDTSAIIANTTDARIKANDSRPIAITEENDEDSETAVAKTEEVNKKTPLTDGESNTDKPIIDEEEQTEDVLVQEDTDDSEQVADNNITASQPDTEVNNQIPGIIVGGVTSAPTPTPVPPVDEPTTEPPVEEETHRHTEITTTTAATCTAAGKTVVSCSECGEVLSETDIPMIAHSYGEWVVTNAATCEITGMQEQTCTVCNQINEQVVEELGHDYEVEYTVDIEPTCTSTGVKSRHCTRCESKTEELGIAAIDHTGEVSYIDGTETTEGSMLEICSVCDTTINEVRLLSIPLHFPDDVFAQYVTDNFDVDGHNSLSEDELQNIQAATRIDVSGIADSDGGIASLEGIHYFASLEELECGYNNSLTEIYLANNNKLKTLSIENCDNLEVLDLTGCKYITSLNIPTSGNIKELYLVDTSLTELDVTALYALEQLDVRNVPLTDLQVNSEKIQAIDLSASEELETLDVCGCYNLRDLDVSVCSNLISFRASDTLITGLDFSNCNQLNSLMLDNNLGLKDLNLEGCEFIVSLDIGSNTNIQSLNVAKMGIASLDTAGLEHLQELNVSHTGISVLNLMNNPELEMLTATNAGINELHVGSAYISSLDLTTNVAIKTLNFMGCTNLKSLDLSQNTGLTTFTCSSSGIEQLDFNSNTELETLRLMQCPNLEVAHVDNCSLLEEVNFAGSTALNTVTLKNKPNLTSVVVDNCTALNTVSIEDVGIDTIDLSTNTALVYLTILNTNMEALDLSGNAYPSLIHVDISEGNMKSLNISGCAEVGELFISDAIEALNVSGCKNIYELSTADYPLLRELNCSGSGMESLNLVYNEAIEIIDASDCGALTSLVVFGSEDIGDYYPLTSVDVSGCTVLSDIRVAHCPNLTSLNISTCPALEIINISNTGVTTLDVRSNSNLSTVYAYGTTALEEIDFSQTLNSQLQSITIADSTVKTLNTAGCQNLTTVTLNEEISYLDVSGCAALNSLGLNGCSNLGYLNMSECSALESVVVSSCSALSELYCRDSGIKSLNLVYNDQLQLLDASGCTSMTYITIHDDSYNSTTHDAFVSMNVADCSSLVSITVGRCPNLTSLDISDCLALSYLDINESGISELEVANNSNLEQLYANGATALTSLDFSETPDSQLWILSIGDSGITDLNLAGCSRIQKQNLTLNDKIEKLNVSHCPSLTTLTLNTCSSTIKELRCASSPITSIDVNQCSNLEVLDVSDTAIESLYVLNCTKLKELNCSNTAVNSLDFMHQPYLRSLDIANTKVPSLNLSSNTALTNFRADGSDISYLNLSNTAVTSINLGEMLSLTTFIADNSALTSVDFVIEGELYNSSLQEISLVGCSGITEISFDECVKAVTIDISGIADPVVEVSTLYELTTFKVNDSAADSLRIVISTCPSLVTLEMTNCPNLLALSLEEVGLQTLDVSGYTRLGTLNVAWSGGITSIVADNCTSMYTFNLQALEALDSISVQGCSSLTELDVSTCLNLATIDATNSSSLKTFYTGGRYGNGLTITGIDVADCTIQ